MTAASHAEAPRMPRRRRALSCSPAETRVYSIARGAMQLVGVPDPGLPPPTAPLAVVRTFRAYYSPLELHHLVHLQAQHPNGHGHGHGQHKQLTDHRIEVYRQLAAGFIERVANRLGLQVVPPLSATPARPLH